MKCKRFLGCTIASALASAITLAAQTPAVTVLAATQGKTPTEDALLIFDPAAKKVTARIPLGAKPHNVAASPDGRYAYITNLTTGAQFVNYPGVPKKAEFPDPLPNDSIAVVDLDAKKVLRLVNVGPGAEPHGITFAAGKVFFTCEGWKLVARYDPETNRIDWMGGIGQNRVHELVVTKDGRRIFTSNMASDTVAAVAPWDPSADAQTFANGKQDPTWSTTLIPVGKAPEGIAMSPDEKEVWVLNRAGGSVSIIDVQEKKVKETVDLKSPEPLRMAFSPDGKWAIIADASTGDVLLLDRVTRKEIKRIPNVGKRIHGVVVSPNSDFAYLEIQWDADLGIVDLKKLELTGRIPAGTGKRAFDGMDGIALAVRK
jgi:YVTN family beta-propeller protein